MGVQVGAALDAATQPPSDASSWPWPSTGVLAGAAVVAIFCAALAGVLAPVLVALPSSRLIRLGNAFAAGILVAAALVHLQPAAHDAVQAMRPPGWTTPLPLDGIATLFGVCVVYLLDLGMRARAAEALRAKRDRPIARDGAGAPLLPAPSVAVAVATASTPLLPPHSGDALLKCGGAVDARAHAAMAVSGVLAGSLCLHALMEGLSLGALLSDERQFSVLASAILAHKLFAALALGASLAGAVGRSDAPRRARRAAVGTGVLFAALTPAGALFSAAAVGASGLHASFGAALLNCVSAGVFVYVGLVDLLADEVRDADAPDVAERAGVFLLATIAMSALALWV